MSTIEQRLQRLECELRRSQRTNAILAVAVIAIVGIAAAQPDAADRPKPAERPAPASPGIDQPDGKSPREPSHRLQTVEAEEFVLLDQLGRPRAKMAVTDEGPVFRMFDEQGQMRVELYYSGSTSGLRLLDAEESPAVSLELPNNAKHGSLEIKNQQGSTLTTAGGFAIRDREEHQWVNLSLIHGNFPVLGIGDGTQAGPPAIELTAHQDGSRGFKIHNQQGYPLFTLQVNEIGKTHLGMKHPDHERQVQMAVGPTDLDGPEIKFFGAANEEHPGATLSRLELGFNAERESHVRVIGRDGRVRFAAQGK